eukprot:TRINITY_DN9472_c0_g1_i2.p1 TRINITY_DN9472_c0_g1~~TRINITY_DN9472_c0_g1_i2.p1  ORF type:complete len:193 (+),score=38.28 TRINITY_DN9472_c0_g1_i2:179-757(+)
MSFPFAEELLRTFDRHGVTKLKVEHLLDILRGSGVAIAADDVKNLFRHLGTDADGSLAIESFCFCFKDIKNESSDRHVAAASINQASEDANARKVDVLHGDISNTERIVDDGAHGVCSGDLIERAGGVDTIDDVNSVDDAVEDHEDNRSDARVRAPHVRFSREVHFSSGSIHLLGTASADQCTLNTFVVGCE